MRWWFVRRPELIPYAIQLTSVSVTATAARYAYWPVREDQLRFVERSRRVLDAISNRHDVAVVPGGADLVAAGDDVMRAEFRSYVEQLE